MTSTGKMGIKHFPEKMQDLESVSEQPLQRGQTSVTVGWGDCDPAQIAYTGNIPKWALVAIEDWYCACLGLNWYQINLQRGIGTPFVSLSCEFYKPVTPMHQLDMTVFVSRLGTSSVSHHVDAYQNANLCFSVKTTAAFVEACNMKPTPIPPNMRQHIENYIENQGREF